MKELGKWILDELPNDGEWWHDGFDAFIKLAERLLELKMPVDEIKAHLQDIYSAVADEFG